MAYGYRSRRYSSTKKAFCRLHEHAVGALVWPLKAQIHDWLEPVLKSTIEDCNTPVMPHVHALAEIDRTLRIEPSISTITLQIPFVSRNRLTPYDHETALTLEISIAHPTAYGRCYYRRIFGTDESKVHFADGQLGNTPAPEELVESFIYTQQQVETVNTELPVWYQQFPRDSDANADYHSLSAAMHFAPVFNNWMLFFSKNKRLNLAPSVLRLTRSKSFRYKTPMSQPLYTALSSALHLAQCEKGTT